MQMYSTTHLFNALTNAYKRKMTQIADPTYDANLCQNFYCLMLTLF